MSFTSLCKPAFPRKVKRDERVTGSHIRFAKTAEDHDPCCFDSCTFGFELCFYIFLSIGAYLRALGADQESFQRKGSKKSVGIQSAQAEATASPAGRNAERSPGAASRSERDSRSPEQYFHQGEGIRPRNFGV